MSDEQAATAAAPAEKPAGAPLSPVLIMAAIGVVMLAGGAALGTFVVGPRIVSARVAMAKATPPKPKADDAKPGSGQLVKLDNIIVNPAGAAGSRFLMTTVAIEVPDEKSQAELKAHDVEVRDAVMTTLERHTMASLTTEGIRESLKVELEQVIQPFSGKAPWVHVYLPQFVIQ